MNEADSTSEVTREQLEMGDWAQKGNSSRLSFRSGIWSPDVSWRAEMSERPAASVGGWTANSASANVTERVLLEAAHHGDEDAFRHQADTHRTPLLAYLRQPRPFTILMAHDETGRRWVFSTGYDLQSESLAEFTDEQVANMIRAAAAAEVSRNLFRREGEYWTVRYNGSVARLKDAKGLRCLARLLAHPGREFHAADLEAAGSQASRSARPGVRNGAGTGELRVRPDLGDAGELLDARAKAAYKARLGELAAELEEAERCNDPGRAAQARAEREFLVRELARAVGLGGRDRRAASHAERARLNVTRAIRAAMANLARANPSLGQHLSATIRTGRYCSYTPDPRTPVSWEL
jgi:hypothetical protein